MKAKSADYIILYICIFLSVFHVLLVAFDSFCSLFVGFFSMSF